MKFGLFPQTGPTQMVKNIQITLYIKLFKYAHHNDLGVKYYLFEPIDRFLFLKYKINFILQYMAEKNLSHKLSVNMFDNYKEEIIYM